MKFWQHKQNFDNSLPLKTEKFDIKIKNLTIFYPKNWQFWQKTKIMTILRQKTEKIWQLNQNFDNFMTKKLKFFAKNWKFWQKNQNVNNSLTYKLKILTKKTKFAIFKPKNWKILLKKTPEFRQKKPPKL